MAEPDEADTRAPDGRDDSTVGRPPFEAVHHRSESARTTPAISLHPLDADRAQAIVGKRYRILGQPVSGGMGSVFPAHDQTLKRKVAIKLMRGSGRSDGVLGSELLLSEARAMAGLNHPHICRVHEISLDTEVPFIVMEWIDGRDLVSAWSDSDFKRRLSLFVKVLHAVAAAHQAGVVHRDLKPANILVTSRDEPMIVDFGLARSVDEARAGPTMGGTPGYAAPEQFSGEETVGPWTDVYGLGVILFELLTNRVPFIGDYPEAVIRSIRERDPPLPEEFAPDAPWPIQRICLKALERDVGNRYPSARAMLDDVERYLRGEAVAARPSFLTQRFQEQVERQLSEGESWHTQGLITSGEFDRLEQILTRVIRPESHWILDTRRLTWSQVTLYLGGWLVLVGLAVGMYSAWDELGAVPALRVAPAWVVAIALSWFGLVLFRRQQNRAALAYLLTACLASPVAVWLLLYETEWLVDIGNAELLDRVEFPISPEWIGLSNAQLVLEASIWCAVAIFFRRRTASSAMTPFAVIALVCGWVALWASVGLVAEDDDRFVRWWDAGAALWLCALAGLLVAVGFRLNQREEVLARELGRHRLRRHDSWAVLTMSVCCLTVGLFVIAYRAPEIQTLGLFLTQDDPTVSRHAAAFMMNGVLLYLVSNLFASRRTVVRRRLGEALRWIVPSHILVGMLVLYGEADGTWTSLVWLVSVGGVSLGLCAWSVLKQWRPFLFSGLFYLAVAYGFGFRWIGEHVRDDIDGPFRIGLALLGVIVGLLVMYLAWRAPEWALKIRLARWATGGSASS